MVGSVKQWQKSDPQKSAETWTRLANANSMLELELNKLNKFALEQRDSYKHVISSCSGYLHEKVKRFLLYLLFLNFIHYSIVQSMFSSVNSEQWTRCCALFTVWNILRILSFGKGGFFPFGVFGSRLWVIGPTPTWCFTTAGVLVEV